MKLLQILMAEVAGILNGRNLTPVSSDPKDLEPLTANHLLSLRSNPSLPVGSFGKEDSYSKRPCDRCSTSQTYSGTAALLAQLGERRSAEQKVSGSNPGRTNTQGLKITEKKVPPL